MDRGALLVLEVSMNVFVLVNLEIVMYVLLLVMSCLYQLKRRWGLDSLNLCFMSSVCRCCGRRSLVLWQRVVSGFVSPVCACVCLFLCMSLGYVCSFVTGLTSNWESSNCVLQTGQNPQIPEYWAGLQQLGRRILGWSWWERQQHI